MTRPVEITLKMSAEDLSFLSYALGAVQGGINDELESLRGYWEVHFRRLLDEHFEEITDEDFDPEAPVLICGVDEGGITADGTKSMEFPNFREASKAFPDLDPACNSERFTGAGVDRTGGKLKYRFETLQAKELYST